jgi:hypothetical protein
VSEVTPDKVAERVLGFIDSIVGQYAPDDPERAQKLGQARAAIEQGFNDAREILDRLGVLKGEFVGTIDRTHALIQEGLARLDANEVPVGETHEALVAASASASAVQSASFASRQTTSLVIDTIDGDQVTVEIDRQVSASRTRFAANDGDTHISAIESSTQASVSFSFTVQGDLDDDERQAVEALVARVDKVADKFFSGNMPAAFNKVARLEFDVEELAGFSLEMNRSRSIGAVSAYRETMPAEQSEGSLAEVAEFGGELRNMFAGPAPHKFSHPEKVIGKLFHHLVNERASAQVHQLKEEAFSALHGLVDAVRNQQDQVGDSRKVEQRSGDD